MSIMKILSLEKSKSFLDSFLWFWEAPKFVHRNRQLVLPLVVCQSSKSLPISAKSLHLRRPTQRKAKLTSNCQKVAVALEMSEIFLIGDALVPSAVRFGDLFEDQLRIVKTRCVHDVVCSEALIAGSSVQYPLGLRGRIGVQIAGQTHGHAGHHMVAELRITTDRERRLICVK